MPVEIRELVIRASTNLDDRDSGTPTARNTRETAEFQDAIIQECVKQVLDVLQKKRER